MAVDVLWECTYVGPADQFPDYQSIFTDPTYHRPLRKVTCAELHDGFEHDYPELTIARDSRFATIYLYQRES
ncbi:hypothetical protein [Nocardia brasiliensis]|uniref:hypothetical protein n=1 Tax=Nocardia brasiliensis TaxID=37326 RepID=UPI003D8BE4EB